MAAELTLTNRGRVKLCFQKGFYTHCLSDLLMDYLDGDAFYEITINVKDQQLHRTKEKSLLLQQNIIVTTS